MGVHERGRSPGGLRPLHGVRRARDEVLVGGAELQLDDDGDDGARPRRASGSSPTGRTPRSRRRSAGYFLLECDSIDDAVELAAKIPAAEHGAIEVRPVHVDEEASSRCSYALLVYSDQSAWADMSEEEAADGTRRSRCRRWYRRSSRSSGRHDPDVDGNELDDRRRPQDGPRPRRHVLVTDGPFAETKEQIGGVFVINLPDLDDGDPARRRRSRPPSTARSRCARSSSARRRPAHRDGRSRLPGGVGPFGRDPHPRPRRLRPRRGRGAGGVRRRARALAPRRRASQSRRLDRHDRPQPGDRPHPPRPDARHGRPSCSSAWPSCPSEEEDVSAIPDERLALVFTCCHPALARGGAGRADAARRRRADDDRDRARVPRPRADAGPAARAREAEDPRRRHPVPRPARPPAARPARPVLAVLYLVFNEGYAPPRATALVRGELCDEAIRLAQAARGPDAGRARGAGPARADAAPRLPARGPHRPDGELVLLEDQDRSLWNRGADRRRAARARPRAPRLGRPGPYQLQAAIAAVHADHRDAGGDRLARRSPRSTGSWDASRPPRRRAEPRGRGGDGRRARATDST